MTKEETPKSTVITLDDGTKIDWKLATVRQNCLGEALKAYASLPPNADRFNIVQLANDMYRFVIGEPVEPTPTQIKTGWK